MRSSAAPSTAFSQILWIERRRRREARASRGLKGAEPARRLSLAAPKLARLCRWLSLSIVILAAGPARAAGITAFVQYATPGAGTGGGVAVGLPLLTEMLTLEGEVAHVRGRNEAFSLTVWSGNLLLISPIELMRLRPYLATGLGVYRQATADASATSLVTMPGFGAFLRLAGPLHGRMEYRALRFAGHPLQGNQRRFTAGLTLRF